MALGILFAIVGVIMLNAYVTDMILGFHAESSVTRTKLLCITWFIPAFGAIYTMMFVNSETFMEQQSLKQKQKEDLAAWDLKKLNHLTEVHGGELPVDDIE